MMTVVNKVSSFSKSYDTLLSAVVGMQYVVSGAKFNMTCLMLAMQSTFCTAAVLLFKGLGVIKFQNFDLEVARKWWPISFMLATVIYTGSKSLVSLPFHSSINREPLDLMSVW
jgi:GDP-mannose transporter